jgi:uncharacterized membrane protein
MRDVTPPPESAGPLNDEPDRRRRRLLANRAFGALKAQHNAERSFIESIADDLNGVASGSPYLVLHVVWFAVWIPWNLGWFGLPIFDPFPFGLLTMAVSLEAIVLSTLLLFSSNRQAARDRIRSDVEYDVNLKAELEIAHLHEKTDRIYEEMVDRLARIEKTLKSHS